MIEVQTFLINLWKCRLVRLLRWTGSDDYSVRELLRAAHEIALFAPSSFGSLGLGSPIQGFAEMIEADQFDEATRALIGWTSTLLQFELPEDLFVITVESDFSKGTYSGASFSRAALGAWLNMLLALCEKVARNPEMINELVS